MDSSNLITLPRRLTPEDLYRVTGIRVQTWAKWRMNRQGPPFEKLGRRAVRYPADAFQAWLEASRVNPIESR